MNTHSYPNHTKTIVPIKHIFRQHKPMISELASTRMVGLAAHLPEGEFLGWQMQVPTVGLAEISLFGSASVQDTDLTWAFEKLASFEEENASSEDILPDHKLLYEICIGSPVPKKRGAIGFCSATPESDKQILSSAHPLSYSLQFGGLIDAMREQGAWFRFSLSAATLEEQLACRKEVLSHWSSYQVNAEQYLGTPVKAKALLLLNGAPSLRLRTAIDAMIPGAILQKIGSLDEAFARDIWANASARQYILPAFDARILTLEPCIQEEMVIGVHLKEAEVKPLPASHENETEGKVLTIGTAMDISGFTRDITLGEEDLKRHWQIIGQTGTGKSTLLANAILSAAEQGFGLTFFDPHGSTVELLLRSFPKNVAKRVRVIHIGDAENPVPMTIWSSSNPQKEERTISDLSLLFADIFDPKRQGFVGPRWERWFSVFSQAAIALYGRQASFEAITCISQGMTSMRKAYDLLKNRYPALANAIQEEFGKMSQSELADLISWAVCKMQRLTSVPQLRNTLGAGTNALDFDNILQSDQITLIDLASPEIGTHAARTIGTLILMQLWQATMRRDDRSKTHLVFIDEAHLFQTNPLPQMLAESRKFGLGMILAHQHCGQLMPEILDALEANSASFSAFRLSTRDAGSAQIRLGNEPFAAKLSCMNAFEALSTLSVKGRQTEPFTLMISRVKEQKDGAKIAAKIEELSRKTLVEPYRCYAPLTRDEMLAVLDGKPLARKVPETTRPTTSKPAEETKKEASWLDDWVERHAKSTPADVIPATVAKTTKKAG
ncbi:MAG: ATP-binding protein [Lachnospiraceae bacterium]|nr:ATP-binding protein [Lachnospiraceae bacterium]